MTLDDLCDQFQTLGFPVAGERVHPEREVVLKARGLVEAAVIDDQFLADCISYELDLIGRNSNRRGLVPFFTLQDLGIRFAFGYWAPGNTAGPHEHTAWTISAVCRNRLEVLTYNRPASYEQRRLVPKNHFHAPAGRVGYIAEPCIHEPKNTSSEWSLSLHVTSPRDGEPPGDFEEEALPGLRSRRRRASSEPDAPYACVVAGRRKNRCVRQLARIVASMNVAQAPALLERCADLGSPATREFIAHGRQEHEERPSSAGVLERAHPELALSARRVADMVALAVETPHGPVDELFVSDLAADAMEFVTRRTEFAVAELPGDLSDEERAAIADSLVESGLFCDASR